MFVKIDFWSNTEYSGFLAGLIRELNEGALEARQCFQISEASYRAAKSPAARLFLRFRQYVAYPLQLCAVLGLQRIRQCLMTNGKCLKVGRWESGKVEKFSEVEKPSNLYTFPLSYSNGFAVVSTNTFYAPLIATFLHPNVVHLVYDLFPEAMLHSGKWREGTFKVRVVRWVVGLTLRRAKCNVFLGERLKDYVESIHGPIPNSRIIAVGADQSLFRQSPKQRLERDEQRNLKPEKGVDKTEDVERRERRTSFRAERQDRMQSRPDHIEHRRVESDEQGSERSDKTGCEAGRTTSNAAGCDDDLRAFPPSHSAPTVLYCGNFGNMHDSETLFDYWNQLASSVPSVSSSEAGGSGLKFQPSFHFHCSGPKRAVLEEVVSALPDTLQESVTIGDGLGQKEWIAVMEQADVALVSMAPGAETVVMPSKTYSAMMAGQAILAIAPENSDLVDLIRSADCGWWVEPGDVDGLAQALKEISVQGPALLEKRERAYHYAHGHFGQDKLAEAWIQLFGEL